MERETIACLAESVSLEARTTRSISGICVTFIFKAVPGWLVLPCAKKPHRFIKLRRARDLDDTGDCYYSKSEKNRNMKSKNILVVFFFEVDFKKGQLFYYGLTHLYVTAMYVCVSGLNDQDGFSMSYGNSVLCKEILQ